jgi:hypothetical protein
MKQLTKKTGFEQHRWLLDAAVFILIVALGIASRFWLVEMPNFKPIAALVLFGGFFFRRAWPAIAALILIMVASDFHLGVYDWQLLICVYASLALACGLGVWVKRSLGSSRAGGKRSNIGLKQVGRFAIASLTMSTAFYVLTNGAVWWSGQWYPETWSGLVNCYAAGLPFYRATLLGDLFFTGALVGSYALCHALATRWARPVAKPADAALFVC